ncbi:MAG: alkaline phosphatase D family protein [Gammaproteobacteria bacterium]|nr:alkaline phosphatase D family protein [Gammaproteobacteria bacterium]
MPVTRRRFIESAGIVLAAPALSRAATRPHITHGVASGDVDTGSAVLWARADRPARALVEVATSDTFIDARRLAPVDVLPQHDFVMKRLVADLPPGQEIFYRVVFEDLAGGPARSEPVIGRFRTAPDTRRSVRFAWSGDTAGQGWGIDPSRGGMQTYAEIARHEPDFFLHSGDAIYADNPIAPRRAMPDGGTWNNLVVEGVDKVAETVAEFRGRFKYNLNDAHLLAMNARLPTVFAWSDHDVVDNWSDGTDPGADGRYSVRDIRLLAARARHAFGEMTPVRLDPAALGRIDRRIAYGPLLDLFVLDTRSHRGANGPSPEPEPGEPTRLLGAAQLDWLKDALSRSTAAWKVIAVEQPLGVVVWNDWRTRRGVDAVANGDHGAPLGREHEIADLLRFIHARGIDNVVWLTADVHYTAAHHYSPERAAVGDFTPFWEFVSGPVHAGTFGPNELDMTFGPEVVFRKTPPPERGVNLPPSDGLQFFGIVDIDGESARMTVRLMDRAGGELHRVELDPASY